MSTWQSSPRWFGASFGSDAGRLPTDPEVFASFLIATLDGLVIQWLLDSSDTSSGEELIASLRDTMALALARPGARRTEGP